jgi:signal transduction histidine kinase
MAGRVVQTQQAVLVPVVTPEQAYTQIKPEYRPYLDRFGMASLLIVPLRARSHLLGTLGISRDRPGNPYTADDQAFLQDLADRAGLAIENARLFAEAQAARGMAERANQAKSVYLASMSHELRTPLNAILGFTGTLLMKLPGPLTSDQERQLGTVQRSAKHLLALITDLLDLAKIEAGSVQLMLEPVVCQEAIGEVATTLRQLAEGKGLRFVTLAPDEPIVVQSDRRALTQILLNLVGNAIKFTDQGEVRVELLVCDDAAQAGGQRHAVAIRVVVSGIGIESRDQAKLFQEFGRVETAAVRAREGTGLGLRLSRRLADLLRCSIGLASEEGRGSTFTLVIPFTSAN